MRTVGDYVTVPKEVVRNLSLEAIGLMAYLRMIRRGHDAILSCSMGDLAGRFGLDVLVLMHIVEELEVAGYITGWETRDGKLNWAFHPTALPKEKRTLMVQTLVSDLEPEPKQDSGYNRG